MYALLIGFLRLISTLPCIVRYPPSVLADLTVIGSTLGELAQDANVSLSCVWKWSNQMEFEILEVRFHQYYYSGSSPSFSSSSGSPEEGGCRQLIGTAGLAGLLPQPAMDASKRILL